MKKCLKHLGRDCVRLIAMFIGMNLVVFFYNTWEDTSDSFDTSLWLQSTERKLEEQNEQYYNKLYDRYSRIERDLNTYQHQTNQRLESLERRIGAIEDSLKRSGTYDQ